MVGSARETDERRMREKLEERNG